MKAETSARFCFASRSRAPTNSPSRWTIHAPALSPATTDKPASPSAARNACGPSDWLNASRTVSRTSRKSICFRSRTLRWSGVTALRGRSGCDPRPAVSHAATSGRFFSKNRSALG
jgi:hypothetical protein